jgi:L-ascorbate metabolism protein UlaG (beta-lactamase superfamily)
MGLDYRMQKLKITWYGHATFLIQTPGGRRLLIDPWFADNPACPESMKRPPKVDVILITHGHADHMADAVAAARESNAPVVGMPELCDWLERKGLARLAPMNKGGSQDIAGLRITMTDARHSSGYVDNGQMVYMGEPAGYVVKVETGLSFYHAGDTSLFGDMRLIGEMYKPDIAFLPIGDRFTMDPAAAARACEFLGVRQVVPMHWGTHPRLTGTPAELRRLVEPRGIDVLELRPGESSE